jgi:hypothetical protein
MPIVIAVASQKTSKEASFKHYNYKEKGKNVYVCEKERKNVTPLSVGYIVVSR